MCVNHPKLFDNEHLGMKNIFKKTASINPSLTDTNKHLEIEAYTSFVQRTSGYNGYIHLPSPIFIQSECSGCVDMYAAEFCNNT